LPKLTIRKAGEGDAELVVGFIQALAKYERLAGPDAAGEARLRRYGWGEHPRFEVLLAFEQSTPVGFALYFYQFSTFEARPTLYLEDLFVYPEHRGKGFGKALLSALACEAVANDCGRMDWMVLDWNQPAIEFYKRLGAEVMSEWRLCRLDAGGIASLAKAAATACKNTPPSARH
jgi:GNAT superfamily N-acetyltransferase